MNEQDMAKIDIAIHKINQAISALSNGGGVGHEIVRLKEAIVQLKLITS